MIYFLEILWLIMNFVESFVSIALGEPRSTVGVKPITRQAICQPDSTPACYRATCILFLLYFLLIFLILLVYLFLHRAKVSEKVCDSVKNSDAFQLRIQFRTQIWNVPKKIRSFHVIDFVNILPLLYKCSYNYIEKHAAFNQSTNRKKPSTFNTITTIFNPHSKPKTPQTNAPLISEFFSSNTIFLW